MNNLLEKSLNPMIMIFHLKVYFPGLREKEKLSTTLNIMTLIRSMFSIEFYRKNLELFDLMYVENDKIYFIHVKKDLAGDTRVLCAQIEHAMQTLRFGLLSDE